MRTNYDFDTVVIGSGPGGLTVAIGLGVLGKKVCMVEKAHIGGDCTNYGCVPSKALLHYAKTHEGESISLVQAMNYAREQRQDIRDEETPEILGEYGVETRFGFGSLVNKHTVRITKDSGETETITTKRIVICTGAKANTIEIPGVKKENILTNEELFEIDYEIKDLVIIGDGVIACEMAEAFSDLGIKVTIVSKHKEILDCYDLEIGTWMRNYLTKKGVTVLLNSNPIKADSAGRLIVSDGEKEHSIGYDKVLLAIGKVPLMNNMGLEEVGVNTEKSGIITNRYGNTSIKNIWSIGDCVANNPRMTHRSNHQGRHLVQNMIAGFNFANPSQKKHPLPGVIYTDYEVATVGLQEKDALKKHKRDNLVIRTHHFAKNDRSKVSESGEGFMKIIAKRGTLRILGVSIITKNAGEMLPLYTYAVKKGLTIWSLSSLIFAYPTRVEIVKLLIDDYLHDLSKNRKEEISWVFRRVFLFWR